MQLRRYSSAAAFLDAAETDLLRAEAENSLILGHARTLATAPPPEPPYFATVHDDDGICAAAFRTVPTKIGVTRARREEALAMLGADAAPLSPEVTDVNGPMPDVEVFARALASDRGVDPRLKHSQGIYELTAVASLDHLPEGRCRLATPEDAELLVDWTDGFMRDIGETGDARAQVAARLAREMTYLWDDDGATSMAAWARPTLTGVTVNFVYTPEARRGKGYATALVAALSRKLLDEGRRACFLYTDLRNPTSNAIYRRIGYRFVSEAAVYRLG